ncbi:MAG: hypothetical protein IPL59_02225 [Candidatus Competibacteraceae bacterium]|nr:hypothetical protein [Candidatus Competibacteraceae bacterium]
MSNATLYAPAGRINLAAVGSVGEVIPTETGLNVQAFRTLGTFMLEQRLAERPTVNLGDPFGEVPLGNLDASGQGGGAIFIRGGQWVSRGGSVLTNTYGDQEGRGVDVVLSGAAQFEGDGAGIEATTFATGDAGVGHPACRQP